MAVTQVFNQTQAAAAPPHVRHITNDDLKACLREGMADFGEMRGDLLFVGVLYPLIGLVAAVATLGGSLIQMFLPITAGIALLGPLVATGFYELARRREAGQESNWSHFLDVRRRPSYDGVLAVGGLLIAIFAAWLIVAAGLYALLMGPTPPVSIEAFAERLFLTGEGWALIILGSLFGIGFAWLVLSISLVSMPMLIDRDASAAQAVAVSREAVRANRGVVLRWGIIVAALLALGSIPLFIGLAVVLPWLGYSTWHLYTRLVDRSRLPIDAP